MIVFICGAINAGKSSVGKLLADRLNAAFIEGDSVRNFLSMLTVDEARPAIVEGIVAATAAFAKRDFSVVVAYPLWNDDYERLQAGLAGVKAPVHYIALNPSLKVAQTNRGGREIGEWEINRIKELYEKGVNKPDFAESVDNSDMTAEECADHIYSMLTSK
jgi:cytidylate kinase